MLKNIIFDVGDVLLEYRWKDMLMEYGLEEDEAVRVGSEMFDNPLWTEGLDMGLMTQEQVIAEYKRQFPEDGKIIEWFINHGEYMHVARPEVWEKARLFERKGTWDISVVQLLGSVVREAYKKCCFYGHY